MGRENKKEAVAALHRETILSAAEQVFSEKGFAGTTIEDLSQASQYSRRTIYAYYESKEDILHHIIVKGLLFLKAEIQAVMEDSKDFLVRYRGICRAMRAYQTCCPHSVEHVTKGKPGEVDPERVPAAVRQIFTLGSEINEMLASWVEAGKKQGAVRKKIKPMPSVYILWSGITSLLTLVQSKGPFLRQEFSMTEEEFLDYGFTQIINSILEVPVKWKTKQA